MIHHVIWDFDGTLFDTYPAMARAFREALIDIGSPELPSIPEILAPMKITLDEARRVFVAKKGLPMEDFRAAYRRRSAVAEAETAFPFAAAKQLCMDVVAAGGKNYIYTHRNASALPMLEKFGMLELFEEIVTAEAGFARKPAPDAVRYLMHKYSMDSVDAIMIGDRELDVLSGVNAGIRACLLAEAADTPSAAEAVVTGFSAMYTVLGLAE